MKSALYRGVVTHWRLRPRQHRLRYRVFWLLLDLDERDAAPRRLRLLSRGRFNLLSFHDRDYGDGSQTDLREQVETLLTRHGVEIGGGAVQLLTMPRVLGYVFNPISLYYCHADDGRLAAMIYEVTSTFGERHSYVIPVDPDAGDAVRQGARKALHVSPFMGMDMDYAFRGRAPGERIDLTIDGMDREGLLLRAVMTGRRHALTDRAILSAAMAVPLMTLKVIAGIHWEALKLWLKGVRLHPAPTRHSRQN